MVGGGEKRDCVDDNVVGGGEDYPFRFRESKVGISGLPRDITQRRPVDGDGEQGW